MMHDRRRTPLGSTGARTALALIFFIAIAATTAQPAWGQPCVVPDDGSGTVQLPPAGCAYLSPAEVHMIIDGLPPGTTIEVSAEHSQFLNIITSPGGTLGGEIESFESYLYLTMTGTDSLAGFSRTLTLPVGSEVHTGPRTPGDPVQTFPNDMYRLQGQIVGDPDFALLQVTAGTDFGLLSPGETTLTDLGDGTWNIDSFFDITYQIDFVGAPGGSLDGLSGSTTATIRMETGEEAPPVLLPCVLPDNGTGTVDLPPAGCGYVSPTDLHKIIAGLPPGSEIDIAPEHSRFINIVTTPGGTLGGEVETFDSTLKLHMTGIGALAGFSRVLEVPISCETHVASRRNGDPVQVIQAKMYSLLGGISGDPDFDQLTVRAGESFGLPASDGQVTLTDLGDGSFNVDSFFDITYEIEFTGAAGGALDGLSGTTEDSLIMQAGVGGPPALAPVCEVEDNGTGTADLPPPGCTYVGPEQIHRMIAGLPPGTEIHISPAHSQFFNVIRTPGGPLGGEIETFDSSLELQMKGIGGLAGFTRTLTVPVACETHTAPRNLGSPVQNIPTEMASLQGEIIGDPDFDLLRVTAGSAYGLPSPGNTELTRLPNGNFNVDSFFDIQYRIEFAGAVGGALDGLSGTTEDSVDMVAGQGVPPPQPPPCVVQDNGTGTIDLPPPGCKYIGPLELHRIIAGLPPGTTINVSAEHARFFNVTTQPGGSLGGEKEEFDSFLDLTIQGTGDLAGFERELTVRVGCEVHTGPRTPGDPSQDFENDMVRLEGEIRGDPDFQVLRIRGGTGLGLPSPGHTTLTQLPSGDFAVDSFFDVTYQIEFEGAPGGALDGLAGTTQSTIRMQAGQPPAVCPPIPGGVDTFPSIGELVVRQYFGPGSDPFDGRVSSAKLPDTDVRRQDQVGDTIDTEILSLNLSGSHPSLGRINVTLNPLLPSTGRIENVVQDSATCELIEGDSFFDVFYTVDLPALGETWVNNTPARIRARLTSLPPKDVKYENPYLDPVVLYDVGTGTARGEILYHLHHVDPPFPPPDTDCFPGTVLDLDFLPTIIPSVHLTAVGQTDVERGGPFSSGRCTSSGTLCATDIDCPSYPLETCGPAEGIQTEIVSMALYGDDPDLGPFSVTVRELGLPSLGEVMTQQPDRSYPADSFFDVFVDVRTGQLAPLHNEDPVRIYAQDFGNSTDLGISNLPPDPETQWVSQPGVTYPLFDDGGAFWGEITNISHTVGPPIDWRPIPPAEDYCFDSWIVLQVTIYPPADCSDTVRLPGLFRILRTGPTDPGTGLDLMDTLMAKALFDGHSDCTGNLTVRLSPSLTSQGQIQSLAPDENFPADSFFDVFVEIDSGIGQLHTAAATHMTTTINNVPPDPGEVYYGPGTVIPLFDATGVQIGEILEVEHIVRERVVCPREYETLLVVEMPPALGTLIRPAIPLGGAGMLYDIEKGGIGSPTGASGLPSASCFAPLVPGPVSDPAVPPVGEAYFYMARERFGIGPGAFIGTYDSGGTGQAASRDPALTSPVPPHCP